MALLGHHTHMLTALVQMKFYFLDTSRSPDEAKYNTRRVQDGRNDAENGWEVRLFLETVNDDYNKGFIAQKALLGTSSTVNC